MSELRLAGFPGHVKYLFDTETGAYQELGGDFRWPAGLGPVGYGAEITEGIRHRRSRFLAFYNDGQTLRLSVDGRSVDVLDSRVSIEKTASLLKRGFIIRESGKEVLAVTYSLLALYRMSDPWDGTDLIDYIQTMLARGRTEIEAFRKYWNGTSHSR
jgi:hypothetical protein